MNSNIWKNIGAILAGFVTVFVLSVVTDVVLESLGIFPSIGQGYFGGWMAAIALIYRSLYTILGGYITAKLSPDKPMRNVMILGIIGTIAALGGFIATWGKGLGPEWYPILLVVLGFPCIWLGGKLHIKGSARTMIEP